MSSNQKGENTSVLLVRRKDAKQVKDNLEGKNLLDRNFRMTESLVQEFKEAIAIPVVSSQWNNHDWSKDDEFECHVQSLILYQGDQFCPYSTHVLGNCHGQKMVPGFSASPSCQTTKPDDSSLKSFSLSLVQHALVSAIRELLPHFDDQFILNKIQLLPQKVCPKNLELLGDDRTVVIPTRAFSLTEPCFAEWLENELGLPTDMSKEDLLKTIWKKLALLYHTSRVVRKGQVQPESGVRESNFQILWPFITASEALATGPGSPGWITVTEQGIRQSFDLTRVMFSRGNITEKVRMGKLVQPGERVLDLYGGIGYFTLPALVHGQAQHVHVCEWNPHAIQALKFNLNDNHVADRCTVYQQDARKLLDVADLRNCMNRVILGLLPSSEGGWETAVTALQKRPMGGWLHIHGNVPALEVESWALWVCSRLASILAQVTTTIPDTTTNGTAQMTTIIKADNNWKDDYREEQDEEWIVGCAHIEKVKSFAPGIFHYVADIYIGPTKRQFSVQPEENCVAGVVLKNGCSIRIIPDGAKIIQPSCALSLDGPLHQEWMFPTN